MSPSGGGWGRKKIVVVVVGLSVGKAKRAERSGLPVMLSVSETSHFSKRSPCGDPSLTLRMTILILFCSNDKKSNTKKQNLIIETIFSIRIRTNNYLINI